MLLTVRLRSLQADPEAFASSYEREVDRPVDTWEKWASESSTGYQQCLVAAESDGVFVGMAGAYTPQHRPLTRELVGMWVTPKARSGGVGAGLVVAITDWSKEGGAEAISLWVVESNQVAYRLYARAGFADTGEFRPLPSNPSLNEIQMMLRLT